MDSVMTSQEVFDFINTHNWTEEKEAMRQLYIGFVYCSSPARRDPVFKEMAENIRKQLASFGIS